MTRSLAALVCFTAALFGAPARSDAGVIPWLYDSIFGYGPAYGGGGGYGWGAGYGYRGAYTAGYAPFYAGYAASYAPTYGNACCGTTTNYAPWTGYDYGGACCSPCGTGCGNGCGTGCGTSCDPGCGNNCPGGNCGTGSGAAPVQSTPADTGASQQPTYAPPTSNDNNRTPPTDEFKPAQGNPLRNRDGLGAGSTTPSGGFNTPAPAAGGFPGPGTGGSNVDPNANAPIFGPGEPTTSPRPARPNEDSRYTPKSPLEPGEKVAFKMPARITRTSLQQAFELPTIVNAPPTVRPEAVPAPTAVASK